MDSVGNVQNLVARSGRILSKRWNLLSLWQNIADHFYPMRADFTIKRDLGDELNDQLFTSYPLLVHRDLSDSFSSMLRPTDKDWFYIVTDMEQDDMPHDARVWLEHKAMIMRKIMYKRDTSFVRATKEADRDFAAFGNAVIQIKPNKNFDGIFYKTHHLRDVAWIENDEGKIVEVHRKFKMYAIDLMKMFDGKVHSKVKEMVDNPKKDSYQQVECVHMMIPSDDYETTKYERYPYVSVIIDMNNEFIMEEIGSQHEQYIIPRWTTVAGSQYAHSPAAITALPDARLIQQMSRVILEAGEKTTNPPMIATQEAVTSSIDLYPGGVTWLDAEYDEKLGEALRPISQNYSGLPIGIDMREQVAAMIGEAFYINKLNLPPPEANMTAYEVGQRVQQYIRQALPLFEPLENNYNGQVCEQTFSLLLSMGAFGAPGDIPQSLQGREIRFKFESPLHDSVEELNANRFVQSAEMLKVAAELDQTSFSLLDVKEGFRDALGGIGVPQHWIRSEEEVERESEQFLQQQKTSQALEAAGAATQVAAQAGEAQKALTAPLEG